MSLIFPKQKISSSKKDKAWMINCTNYVVAVGEQNFTQEISRKNSSYKLINSQLEESEFRNICSTLGVSTNYGKRYIQAYNKVFNIYSTLKGEELQRSFKFSVINISPQATNEILRHQQFEHQQYVSYNFAKEFEVIVEKLKLEVQTEMRNVPFNERAKAEAEIRKQVEEKYSHLLSFERLEERSKSFVQLKEATLAKLLKICINRQNIKWIKNESFGDAIIAGEEFVEVKFEKGNPLPIIKQINPLDIFYHKSPDTPFTHDSDFAGYKERITFTQALDEYQEDLDNDDLERLQLFAYNGSAGYGTTDTMFRSPGDPRHASDWVSKTQAGMYPSGPNLRPEARVMIDGQERGIPNSGYAGGSTVRGQGLYSTEYDSFYRNNYVIRYTTYWKSYRKIYVFTKEDNDGELVSEFVSEDFVIPSNAKKESYRENKFSKLKYKYIWYDKENKFNSAEEIWIPEIWKSVRLNGDIFVDYGPLEHAYQSLLNPYATKLPIYGCVFNARNASNISIIDRTKPWQKLYYAMMAKVLKLISQDKGVLTFLNVLMVDSDLGVKKTLELAEDHNLIPYNPLAHAKGGQLINNTHKIAEKVDTTNASVIEYYIKILEFIETNLTETVGMSPQRLSQFSPRTNASDNQKAIEHSMNITESLFNMHDLLWEHIMQGYMEMLVSSLNDDTSKLRGFLNSEEIALIDLGHINLEDEYLFKVGFNSKEEKIKTITESLAMHLIQNDKVTLSTLIELLNTDDLVEFQVHLKEIEKEIENKAVEAQQREQEAKMEELNLQWKFKENEQKAKLDEVFLKGKMELEKEHVKGQYLINSFNLKNDLDQNGVSDLLEEELNYTEMLSKVSDVVNKSRQKDRELDIKESELALKSKTSELEALQQKEDKLQESFFKEKELKLKEEIEKLKVEAQKQRAASSSKK